MSELNRIKDDWRRGTGPRTAPDMARDLVQEYGALSALRLMNDLGTDLYVEEKDLMGALQWLDTCIQFGLALSLGLKDTPRKEVLNEAKAAAYHMAYYCWPGWGDPAIKVSESEKKLGLQMAKLNMTLCHELRKPDIVAARGHWLLGAMIMAFGVYQAAISHFRQGAELAARAGETDEKELCEAFAACCDCIWQHKGRFVETDLDRIIQQCIQHDPAGDLARQLTTAMHVFKPTSNPAHRAVVAV